MRAFPLNEEIERLADAPALAGSAAPTEPAPASPVRRLVLATLALFALTFAFVCVCHVSKGQGYKSRILRHFFPASSQWLRHPAVTLTRPATDESGVPVNGFIAADVKLPNSGKVVDAATVSPGSIRLFRTGDHAPIEAAVNTSGGGDSIVLTPLHPLETNTQYTFEVLPALKDTAGASFQHFTASFTTAASSRPTSFPAAFEQVELPGTSGNKFTCVTFGPDHRLYASTLDGRIFRFDLRSDGTLYPPKVLDTVQTANHAPRLITGIRFDPAATESDLVLWVTHGQRAGASSASNDDWTCKLSRLSGRELENYQDYLINLPRGSRDHLTNQMDFGPDGALYFGQASNTAMGAPDSQWNFRPERLLTATILRADVQAIATLPALPLDVRTPDGGGAYDPFAPGAPVTLYATGVRNAFDVLWHSNGRLYAPVNGSSAGGSTPATPQAAAAVPQRIDAATSGPYTGPAIPALRNVPLTEEDFFIRVAKGGYYGHPNPTRGEYVLDGGNPTAGPAPYKIPQYPLGTQPDRNWRVPEFSFGKNLAPCGLIEYTSDACPALKGKILVTRFSGGKDLLVLSLGPSGEVTESLAGIEGFTRLGSPLSLTQDPINGSLYVSEFAARKITLLRPKAGSSQHVFRQAAK